MINFRNNAVLTKLVALLCLTMAPLAFAQASGGEVMVYGQHVGGQIQYSYQIINGSQYHIAAMMLGWDTQNDNNSANDGPELASLPSGWDSRVYGKTLPDGSFTVPTGWKAEVVIQEGSLSRAIRFGVGNNDHSFDINPGQSAAGFSITLPKLDDSYLNGHAVLYFSDAYPTRVTVPLVRLDTTPPVLSLSVAPARLQASVGTLVNVVATIVTTDDYDPAPEIKLESITANEPLAAGDIVGADIGTDDRQFQLRDVKVPAGTAGRIYTIKYSATDSSGNKATKSATVKVK
jgi:hypothetical protein